VSRNRTTDIWADSRGGGICKGCGAPLTWAEIVKSGKRMPFEQGLVALRTRHEAGRLIEEVDLADNHWAKCPKQAMFRK
jgi:hypothetical protein